MAKKRDTLDSNPLDRIGLGAPQKEQSLKKDQTPQKGNSSKKENIPQRGKKEYFHNKDYTSRRIRLTVNLPEDLIDYLKDIVFYSFGENLTSFAERAILEEIKKAELDRGEPFPARTQELKRGRPPK